jgi:hypothetical protein
MLDHDVEKLRKIYLKLGHDRLYIYACYVKASSSSYSLVGGV